MATLDALRVSALPLILFLCGPATVLNPLYFTYVANQSKNVLYQSWLFCGFNIQCPSSGNTINFDGTPCRCSALNNSIDCVYGTR